MDLIIGLLTIVLVLNCLFLILLILVQLPKKDAGAGVAFGGGTTDALFGSGTGTVLTKATRYGTTVFLALSLGLSVLQSHQAKASRKAVLQELDSRAAAAPAVPAAATGAEAGDATTPDAGSLANTISNVTVDAATSGAGAEAAEPAAQPGATDAGEPTETGAGESADPVSATNAPPTEGGQ
ncbi:MAG: preprotein translocase subunit SecG [Verrucomicrobiae bacterium]|nr:preprotein translocase subunit SecG [Verrucomicrobiae bacterium]MCP5519389.1 preprotein translocase subunit SecG [Verrucomicrobiales bacterium]MCP5526963.1 preprotein translocase subunit SecG [Verrucomicrobiales bacterium]